MYISLQHMLFLIISMNVINVLEPKSVYVRWEEYSVQHVIVAMDSFQNPANEGFNVMSVG